ncbi:fumarylacetoacetate hydrolase family protein [Qingshengfaniella alkalisoli]|uniref:Fumarylacetoacetate hydrolase family protein n=1 Tax=Qingshengfaniella alkalisoli TaxID=2599296 RepID=A0A5B8ISQ2_9RHOB|nr:fumarylacetoacetate hydrolase family protein [Qingshengfaniella alkalisoli]QDY68634.1 fumarylacetoacetate hydrolase family protein [Qingshengfaniella alkalisoli]
MTEYVFEPHDRPSLPVYGSHLRFPVRRIFCVGRNYAEHAREMGHDPDREPPFFFSKPADALVESGACLPFPPATDDLHFEAELVVAIGKPGTRIAVEDAPGHIWGFAAGNDLTRRDLQATAKSLSRPWDMAKGFDNSAVCGELCPIAQTGLLSDGPIRTKVDGKLRQDGNISDMVWSIPELISELSALVELAPGDLIYTGTPAGVGSIRPGQSCTVEIAGLPKVSIRFIP